MSNPFELQAMDCADVLHALPAYLNGEVPGTTMAAIGRHLEDCPACAGEFACERELQEAFADMREAAAPAGLQAQLKLAVTAEHAAGRHLSWPVRARALWQSAVAPLAARTAVASVATILLGLGFAATVGLTLDAPGAVVQANDSARGAATPPHYLYSIVPPQAVPTGASTPGSIPIVVDAQVNADGRVYDFSIQAGPADDAAVRAVRANLLNSIFRPATMFGQPVPGHVMLVYTGISVKG